MMSHNFTSFFLGTNIKKLRQVGHTALMCGPDVTKYAGTLVSHCLQYIEIVAASLIGSVIVVAVDL